MFLSFRGLEGGNGGGDGSFRKKKKKIGFINSDPHNIPIISFEEGKLRYESWRRIWIADNQFSV